jgi:hypothetical protein
MVLSKGLLAFKRHVFVVVVFAGVALPLHVDAKRPEQAPRGGAAQNQAVVKGQINEKLLKDKVLELLALGCSEQEIIAEFETALAGHDSINQDVADASRRRLVLILIDLLLIGLDYYLNEYGDDEDYPEPVESVTSSVTVQKSV